MRGREGRRKREGKKGARREGVASDLRRGGEQNP